MDCKKRMWLKGGSAGNAASKPGRKGVVEGLLPVVVWRNRRNIVAGQGQGTVEYAILVGILVVIAILAITVFRPKIQELWDAIASGINGL